MDVRVLHAKSQKRKVGPAIEGHVGGYVNTLKGQIQLLQGMSSQKMQVPSSSPRRAYDHEKSRMG